MDGIMLKERAAVAIIGLGYRGLSAFERLSAHARNSPKVLMSVTVIDPSPTGEGIHDSALPDYHRLNTIVSQIGLCADPSTLPGSKLHGNGLPSFTEFCSSSGAEETKIHAEDFVPRAFLGKYLKAFFEETLTNIPSNMTVSIRADKVVSVNFSSQKFTLEMVSQEILSVDHVIVCTGHGIPAPIQLRQHAIKEEGVIIRGIGLGALDKVLDLTVGRGGQFVRASDGTLDYRPSGQEVNILLQSRSGLPFSSRPRGLSAHRPHEPAFLSQAFLHGCVNASRDGKISFRTDVLPAMKAEMKMAWREFDAPHYNHRQDLKKIQEDSNKRFDWAAIDEVLDWKKGSAEDREIEALLAIRLPTDVSVENYTTWLEKFLEADLVESRIGVPHSKRKVVGEIWRDLRGQLRLFLSQNVLREDEREYFYLTFSRALNRLVTGPQLERTEELLTLIEQGFVQVLHPDVRLHGRENTLLELAGSVSESSGENVIRTILNNLKAMKTLSGKLAVDNDNRVLDSGGYPINGLWALGSPVEGSQYYNHYVPSPGMPSKAIQDADRIANLILEPLDNRQEA